MLVKLAEPPSTKSLRRFARMMQMLDLKTFVDPCQRGRILAPPTLVKSEGESEAANDTPSWPQLTLLTRNMPASRVPFAPGGQP